MKNSPKVVEAMREAFASISEAITVAYRKDPKTKPMRGTAIAIKGKLEGFKNGEVGFFGSGARMVIAKERRDFNSGLVKVAKPATPAQVKAAVAELSERSLLSLMIGVSKRLLDYAPYEEHQLPPTEVVEEETTEEE